VTDGTARPLWTRSRDVSELRSRMGMAVNDFVELDTSPGGRYDSL
jgi:hypothetical protein